MTRKEIEGGVSIRYKERNANRLSILESLIIMEEDPIINRQDTGRQRTLKLYGASTANVMIEWVLESTMEKNSHAVIKVWNSISIVIHVRYLVTMVI